MLSFAKARHHRAQYRRLKTHPSLTLNPSHLPRVLVVALRCNPNGVAFLVSQ